MSQTSPPITEPSSLCELCWQPLPASHVPMRGRLNFCGTCATERTGECLVRVNGAEKRPRLRRFVPSAIFIAFILGVGWLGVKAIRSGIASLVPWETAALEGGGEGVLSFDGPPARVPRPRLSASGEIEAPWLQRLFGKESRRSVEDAGNLHLLYVTRPGTDSRMGLSSQVFATREAPNETSAKLTTEVGPQMAASFEEGCRYVRKQPREWEREFSIRLSFEDRSTSKDGGSAGTGFTIVMLAAIQKIPLDPEVAVTGDLTIDGTVQPVGAIVEKVRGAIVGKCKVTLIPERNSRDIVDLAMMDGTSPLWETQVFAIRTIAQALDLARRDRRGDIASAIVRFDALRARLPATVTPNYLQSPVVQDELKKVLQSAPNHLSASILLQAAQNRLPHELSLNRSVDEVIVASYFFVSDVIGPKDKTRKSSGEKGITVFPEREYGACMRNLSQLTPILDRRAIDLKSACASYADAVRAAWTYQSPDANAVRTRQQWMEVARREQDFQRQLTENVDQARSRLLLALRKLDTDGSLMSELLKK